MRISRTASNTSAQHALGQWSSTLGQQTGTRLRNYKMYAGGHWWHHSPSGYVIGRFFLWIIVARVLPGRGKIVKRWPVRGCKRVVDHCFSVYLSNTYCRYKRLFGTPTAFSVMCSLWKMGPIFLDPLQTFCELMI